MTRQKKTLQMLTFKNEFMFGTAMAEDPESCAGVIERATGIPVERIEVSREKSMVYHPEYKGIRLDVYALLKASHDYKDLPNTIVIFICDFDPFGLEKYRYTFQKKCKEDENANLEDGQITIFLSTHGKNKDEVPKGLVAFLEYVKADLEESTKDFGDDFVKHLQDTVRKLKVSREVEERYMVLEEMLKDAENRIITLSRRLIEDNRLDDWKRAIDDEDFREKLYEEYHIE